VGETVHPPGKCISLMAGFGREQAMKVKLRPEAAGRDNVRGWLRVGREYVALSVESITGNRMAYRIVSEDNRTPALFGVSLFDVVDGRIPESWVAVRAERDMVHFMPAGWGRQASGRPFSTAILLQRGLSKSR